MKRRPGRPITERKRISMGFRVSPGIREQLLDRSSISGRSITQQIEMLIEIGLIMEKISDAGLFDTLLGARLSLRDQAKQILSMMDRSHPEDVAKAGWTLVDITLLERLAEMKMLGIEEAP